jgi:hypothetical protein
MYAAVTRFRHSTIEITPVAGAPFENPPLRDGNHRRAQQSMPFLDLQPHESGVPLTCYPTGCPTRIFFAGRSVMRSHAVDI